MATISINELNANLASVMLRVASGETLLVLDGDKPVAEIRPATESRRPSGLCAGQFIVPDDFDEPLPEEILASFDCNVRPPCSQQ